MSGDARPPKTRTFPIEPLASELYAKSGAARYGLPPAEFTAILGQIAGKYLPDDADEDRAPHPAEQLAYRGTGFGAGLRRGKR